MIDPAHRPIAEEILAKGKLDVYLVPRTVGVTVPSRFRHHTRLILRFGYDLAVPIPDLAVTDAGISGTLSFEREASFCDIPWRAVFALVAEDGAAMVWSDLTPDELRR